MEILKQHLVDGLRTSVPAVKLAFSFLVSEEQEKPDYSNSFYFFLMEEAAQGGR